MTRVAINGLGRIGRAVLKIVEETPELDLVAVNDRTPVGNLAYLLCYDSVYGRHPRGVSRQDDDLVIGDRVVRTLNEPDPARLPWRELAVDIVFECTGAFRRREDLDKHLDAGARHAILSAPSKGDGVAMVVRGVNELTEEHTSAFSTASCTTNCVAPLAEIMARRVGVKKAVMTTVHAYTSSQGIVDTSSDRMERGRAGAANITLTSTGAAAATIDVLPQYAGHFDGLAVRVPVPVGSLVDLTLVTERATSVDEVNGIFREEARTARYQGILGVTEDPIVSSDVIRDSHAALVDLTQTRVVDGDLVKVLSWYDNEWGYASQMVRQACALGA